MNYPHQAVVDTGTLTHPDWKTGEIVWVLDNKKGVCEITRDKDSKKPEGTLRRDALVFDEES